MNTTIKWIFNFFIFTVFLYGNINAQTIVLPKSTPSPSPETTTNTYLKKDIDYFDKNALTLEKSINAPLTIYDCLTIALSQNYSLLEAEEAKIRTEIEYYNRLNEKLKLGAGGRTVVEKNKGSKTGQYTDGFGELTYYAPSGDTVTASINTGRSFLHPFTEHGISAEYRHPFLKGRGRIVAWQDIRQAERDIGTAEIQYFLLKQEIASSIINRYFSLILSQKIIELNEIYVANSKDNFELTNKKFTEGLVPRIDLSRAQLLVINSENSFKSSKKRWADQKDSMLLLLSLDPRTEIETTYDIPYMPILLDEKFCIEMGLYQRKELLLDETNLQRIRDELIIAQNNRKAKLDFVTKVGNRLTVTNGFEYFSSHSAGWSAMLEYYVDLNKTRLDTDIKQSQRELSLAWAKTADRQRIIIKEIRDALRNLTLAESTVINREENVKLARERLQLARRTWEEGLVDNREMIEARQALMTADSDLIAAKIEYILAQYDLKKAMGYDLFDVVMFDSTPGTNDSTQSIMKEDMK